MKQKFAATKKALFATLLALIIPLTAVAQSEPPSIDMQAEARREVTPDELYLSIIIKESDYKGKKTLQELQEAMIFVLRANKIDVSEALTLDFMGSSIDYKTFTRRPTTRSEASYMLKLSDATTMQKIIHELEERNITNISLARTKFTKSEELITELGVEAMKKARTQAAAYAAAVEQSIGKAIRISSWDTSNSQQPRMYKSRSTAVEESADNSLSAAEPQQTISIGKITYTVHVNVKFELK